MKSIVTIIEEKIAEVPIVKDVTPEEFLGFYCGEKSYQNLQSDTTIFPAAYLDMPLKSYITMHDSGYIEESFQIVLIFMDRVEFGSEESVHRVAIDNMRSVMRRFLAKLDSDSTIRFIDNVETLEFQNLFDANLSGVLLECRVTPIIEDSNC